MTLSLSSYCVFTSRETRPLVTMDYFFAQVKRAFKDASIVRKYYHRLSHERRADRDKIQTS